MKKSVLLSALAFLLTPAPAAYASDKGQSLNAPPPEAVRRLVQRGVFLAERDRAKASVVALRKAISISPNYLRAHIEYRNVMMNFLERRDAVEAEYLALLRRIPENPVLLMALYYRSNGEFGRESLERVVTSSSEWAWGHYANALLLQSKEPEKAVADLQKCIEKDKSATEAYYLLIELQEKRLKKIDDAVATAEKLAVQSDLRGSRLQELWRLRLAKAQSSPEAKEELKKELARLAETTRDVDTLLAVRSTFLNVLKDETSARSVEKRVVQIDPQWNRQQGWLYMVVKPNQSGVPRYVVLANRQIAISEKLSEIARNGTPADRVPRLRNLLALKPSAAMKRMIYEEVFRAAIKSGNTLAAVKYGETLHAIDPTDHTLLAQMALVLATRKTDLPRALHYARVAEKATSEFQPAKRPPNTPQSFFDQTFPEPKQREAYKKQRALALEAVGWVLCQLGRAREAEARLREAVRMERSETRLSHLAAALQKLGRVEEAGQISAAANSLLSDSVKSKFVNEKVNDFKLESLDGRTYSLSELKGKVVMINFWATWCGPCVVEMPHLVDLYEKYRSQGFEVLAVSIDEEAKKVRPFAAKHKLNFPIFHSLDLGEAFEIRTIPANIFIDRQGTVRYRKVGFEEESSRELEVVVRELLK